MYTAAHAPSIELQITVRLKVQCTVVGPQRGEFVVPRITVYRGAYKSLVRPGRKQATATKL